MRGQITAGLVLSVMASAAGAATIGDVLAQDARFSTLLSAAEAAGLSDTLNARGHFTLFAPTDDAFAQMDDGVMATLLLPPNRNRLTEIVKYHIDDRTLKTRIFPEGSNLFKPLLETHRICVTKNGMDLRVSDSSEDIARVVEADIPAENGVIHVIDKVLIPGERPDCH